MYPSYYEIVPGRTLGDGMSFTFTILDTVTAFRLTIKARMLRSEDEIKELPKDWLNEIYEGVQQ